jgi:hypothetical protein
VFFLLDAESLLLVNDDQSEVLETSDINGRYPRMTAPI